MKYLESYNQDQKVNEHQKRKFKSFQKEKQADRDKKEEEERRKNWNSSYNSGGYSYSGHGGGYGYNTVTKTIYSSAMGGKWSDSNTWMGRDTSYPSYKDNAVVNGAVYIESTSNWAGCKDLLIRSDATLTIGSGVMLSISGELENNGTIILENGEENRFGYKKITRISCKKYKKTTGKIETKGEFTKIEIEGYGENQQTEVQSFEVYYHEQAFKDLFPKLDIDELPIKAICIVIGADGIANNNVYDVTSDVSFQYVSVINDLNKNVSYPKLFFTLFRSYNFQNTTQILIMSTLLKETKGMNVNNLYRLEGESLDGKNYIIINNKKSKESVQKINFSLPHRIEWIRDKSGVHHMSRVYSKTEEKLKK
jgi:hypothetical protein